jgi:hypothetical protein
VTEKKEVLFSRVVKAGPWTYFIDVRESAKGNKYLTITESRKIEDRFERTSIMIFDNAIPDVFAALREAGEVVKGE